MIGEQSPSENDLREMMHQVDGNANGMIEIPEFLTMFMSKMNQVWTLFGLRLIIDTTGRNVRNQTKNIFLRNRPNLK